MCKKERKRKPKTEPGGSPAQEKEERQVKEVERKTLKEAKGEPGCGVCQKPRDEPRNVRVSTALIAAGRA